MTYIVPTVTSENAHLYRSEIERVANFAERIHIDLADGVFAPTKLVNPIQVWWPETMVADIHIMYKQPQDHLSTLISLSPNLVILHAESEGDVAGMISELKAVGIKAGVALLEDSQPQQYKQLVELADHVLIFGGKLGYHGGAAQLEMLNKIPEILEINPSAEIAWDGGVNDENIEQLANAGVAVADVGGFIQNADNPHQAYDILMHKLKQ